jgi:hypothetical protein
MPEVPEQIRCSSSEQRREPEWLNKGAAAVAGDGFAHQAGGTIRLSSELGKGTTVTICLSRGSSEHLSRKAVASVSGTGTVLLVEDNPDVALASAGLLEQLGYSCSGYPMPMRP